MTGTKPFAAGLAEGSYPALETGDTVLAAFWRRHPRRPRPATVLHTEHTSGYQVLLGGLAPILPAPAPHANAAYRRWWGVGNATEVLSTGQLVTLEGHGGNVEVDSAAGLIR